MSQDSDELTDCVTDVPKETAPLRENDDDVYVVANGDVYEKGAKEGEKEIEGMDDHRGHTERKFRSIAERLCAFYVERPKTAFSIALSLQLCLLLGNGILYLLNYDIFPYDFTQVPLFLEKDPTKLRADAFKYVNQDPRLNLMPTTAVPQPERTLKTSPVELVFKAKDESWRGTILTKANLLAIDKLEKELIASPSYQKICLRNPRVSNMSMACERPISIIRLFDGTYRLLDPRLYDPYFDRITEVFNVASNISLIKSVISYSLDKNSFIKKDVVYSEHIRSVLFNGIPLPGFKHAEDRKKDQLAKLRKHVVNAFSGVLAEKYRSGIGHLNVYYLNLDLLFNAVENQVIWDLLLAGGSLVFIFSFIWFQTGSLWITGWAVFGILTNFFGANLIYRIVLDFRFIGIFHVLSVFLILGIGADDVFIFFNTWKLMEERKFSSLTQHLTETFRSAAGSMFVTSLTTAAAFFASASSPLLGVSSFGVFSGILVIVNYISVCVYFPSVVVTYHLCWKSKGCSVSRMKESCKEEAGDLDTSPPQDDMTRLFRAVVEWFETTYAKNVVLHCKVKWIVLSCFTALSIVFFTFAMKLGPDEEMTQVWPRGTNWYDMRQIKLKAFDEKGDGLNVIRVYIIWGLKMQDRSKCHFTDFKCLGQTVFDEDFDMNKPGCQAAMLEFCRRLKSLPPDEAQKLSIRRSIASAELEVSCFIEDMDKSFKALSRNMGERKYTHPFNLNFSIPMNEEKVKRLMATTPNVYNVSLITNDYYRYFETALGYWLSGGGRPEEKHDYFKYASYIGGSLDDTVDDPHQVVSLAQGGRYGNRLRYAAVVVNTTITGATIKYKHGNKLYHYWEQYMDKEMKRMPSACKGAFQCTPEWNNWHWLKVQKELLRGARNGIIIGLCVAFPVLVLTTCNWIIGCLAILTIGLITLAVVGLIPLFGWSLGVMESINLTLVVGLSVDYAVHLADGYVRCWHSSREERVKYMLGNVGVSVLAGATTTLGASAFMLGSKMMFFFQFGLFMFCTIGFSIMYALVIFTVLTGVMGPEGDNGSLKRIFRCCFPASRVRGRDDAMGNDAMCLENQRGKCLTEACYVAEKIAGNCHPHQEHL